MATRAANMKGITFLWEYIGSVYGGIALVTFDLIGVPFTGGSDTITLGGGGYDDEVATTNTLAVTMQNRRRDGKTVTITSVCSVGPQVGYQAAASSNGPLLYVQGATLSGGNVTSITLNTAYTGGSAVTTVSTGYWDRPAGIVVSYIATGY